MTELPDDEVSYCTFAVTGGTPHFQAIFVCQNCSRTKDEGRGTGRLKSTEQYDADTADTAPLCICQGCADVCHQDCGDLEFIGMGPCYCDCDHTADCCILARSNDKAEAMGILSNAEAAVVDVPQAASMPKQEDEYALLEAATTAAPSPFIPIATQSFLIPSLLQPIASPMSSSSPSPSSPETSILKKPPAGSHANSTTSSAMTLSDLLIQQARALVSESKETFWLDAAMVQDFEKDPSASPLCEMERLAWRIFQRHVQKHAHTPDTATSLLQPSTNSAAHAGLEWWVQIKNTGTASSSTNAGANGDDSVQPRQDYTNEWQRSAGIEFHYDKDEALAETFGLGYFPAMSTVTYLTESSRRAAPTIILSHTYDMGEDSMISELTVSHPKKAKHIVFDGRLLHGAPAHPAIQQSYQPTAETKHGQYTTSSSSNMNGDNSVRVTFLVNIWVNHKPASVMPLSKQQREKIQKATSGMIASSSILQTQKKDGSNDDDDDDDNWMTPLPTANAIVNSEADLNLPKSLQSRIEHSFVGTSDDMLAGGTTINDDTDHDNDDDEDDAGLVVLAFPPPKHSDTTLRVELGAGMQAYLDYPHPPDEMPDHATKEGDATSATTKDHKVWNTVTDYV